MKLLYRYNMFPYEPEKKTKYLKSLIGKSVIINVDDRNRNIKGVVGGVYCGGISDKIEIIQKKQNVMIPTYRINEIYRN